MTSLERLELVLRTVRAENNDLDILTNTQLLDLIIAELMYRNTHAGGNEHNDLEEQRP